MSDTVLTLSGIGLVPLAGGGISEQLAPINQGQQQRRNVNGTLVDLSLTAFRKYRITLSGGDLQPMALDGVWIGQAATVGCITELSKAVTLTAGAGSVALGRIPVTGSGRAIFRSGTAVYRTTGVSFSESPPGTWNAAVNFSNAALAGTAYVMFRPSLSCRVTNWNSETDEYAARPGWTLELEEA